MDFIQLDDNCEYICSAFALYVTPTYYWVYQMFLRKIVDTDVLLRYDILQLC